MIHRFLTRRSCAMYLGSASLADTARRGILASMKQSVAVLVAFILLGGSANLASPAEAHRLKFDEAYSSMAAYAYRESSALSTGNVIASGVVGQCIRQSSHAFDCAIAYDFLLLVPPYTTSQCSEVARAKYASPTSYVVRVLSRSHNC